MAHSLDGRVPVLDYRLGEKPLALKGKGVIENGTTKYLFREAMKGVLPEKIRNRQDKVGFATPQDEWFRGREYQKMIQGILGSDSFRNRKIMDTTQAAKIYREYVDGKTGISNDIWKWISLERWLKIYSH
jgi:asparagine synthase (glutamine-hydrolysing)